MPARRDDRDVRGAAADVDHHVARGLGDGQARPDGRGHGLVHEIDLGGLGLERRVLHRALLDLGHLGGDADDDARPHHGVPVVRLPDEVREHLLGDLEVGDDPVFMGRMATMLPGRAAEHLLGVLAHRLHLARHLVDRDDEGSDTTMPFPFA
jgi:hypothetical protein